MGIVIRNVVELAKMRRAGAIARAVLDVAEHACVPRTTTAELERIAAREMARLGATSAFDFACRRDGYSADAARTIAVGVISAPARALLDATREALAACGTRLIDVSKHASAILTSCLGKAGSILAHRVKFARLVLVATLAISASAMAKPKHGKVVTERIVSKILHDNLIGLNETRQVMIYLPPGYEPSGKRYPVVYYFHSIQATASSIMEDTPAVQLLERAFASGISKDLIFVVADYSTSGVGSLYENSSVTGRWLDFTTQELVPFIDTKFRTLRSPGSRAAVGDFIGGRGALKLGMTHADLFGVIYALHPVATGMGYLPWAELGIDWKKIMALKTKADVDGLKPDVRAQIFITVSQAFLPNPSRPPLYCDFFVDVQDGKIRVNPENMAKAKKGFMLEDNVVQSVPELKKLKALAFDWASYDGNYDHIFAARNFSRDLTDAGIDHEAEEYRGNPWNKVWSDNGRFYTRVIPFVARNLQFE